MKKEKKTTDMDKALRLMFILFVIIILFLVPLILVHQLGLYNGILHSLAIVGVLSIIACLHMTVSYRQL